MNKKLLGVGIAAVGIIAAVVAFVLLRGNDDKLDKAYQYLQEQDYDSAIAAYDDALAKDDKCAEAYAGKAAAKAAKGNMKEALEDAEEGLEKTKDAELASIVEQLQNGDSVIVVNHNSGKSGGSLFSSEKAMPENGKQLAKQVASADGIVMGGKVYSFKEIGGMTEDDAIPAFNLIDMRTPGVEIDLPGAQNEDNTLFISKGSAAGDEMYCTTAAGIFGNTYHAYMAGAPYGAQGEFDYFGNGDVPANSNAKDLVNTLVSNNIHTVSDLAKYLTGKDFSSDKCLVIYPDDGTYTTESSQSGSIHFRANNSYVIAEEGVNGAEITFIFPGTGE